MKLDSGMRIAKKIYDFKYQGMAKVDFFELDKDEQLKYMKFASELLAEFEGKID